MVKTADQTIYSRSTCRRRSSGLYHCRGGGNDIGDYQVMQKVGFRATPASGEDLIKKDANFIAKRDGGSGAVRDLCNLILETKGVDITTLALK